MPSHPHPPYRLGNHILPQPQHFLLLVAATPGGNIEEIRVVGACNVEDTFTTSTLLLTTKKHHVKVPKTMNFTILYFKSGLKNH